MVSGYDKNPPEYRPGVSRAARTAFLAGAAIALLSILVGAAFAQPDSPTDIGAAKANWAAMTDRCWEEVDDEGHPISETEMKVACITAGVLTAQLVNAGYCLDAKANEWRPCTASRRGR